MTRILGILFIVAFNIKNINAQNVYNTIQVDVNYDYLIEDFSYCSFYEFEINSSTVLENESLINLKNSLENDGYFSEGNPSIQIYSIIEVSWSGVKYNFIYYSKNIDDNKEFTFSGFENLEDPKLETLKSVLKLKNDVFWYFYNNEIDSEFQDLSNARLSVNDQNGILNIEKLAEIIEKNKSTLSQYLDE